MSDLYLSIVKSTEALTVLLNTETPAQVFNKTVSPSYRHYRKRMNVESFSFQTEIKKLAFKLSLSS